MSSSARSSISALLQGLSWLLFAAAGLAFLIGGRAISDFGKINRALAEVEGFGMALVLGALGAVAKSVAEHVGESIEEPTSIHEGDTGQKP